ncbi:transposase [Halopseudomonas pelagia]|uniref:transposase n=1 Tax=Halopseudomonas pelagia TaxID=553151 RepID=UPI0030DA4D65|tara:strand:- start:1623 stop:2462 length:840 start_codon:yes stop_codon:yes gene_type:complete
MKKVPKKTITRKGFTNHITMHELNRELSTHIGTALQRPLHVYRYSSPCVCIVSADLWANMNNLNSYVPAGHVLVGLRNEIDAVLAEHCKELCTLSDRCVSGVSPTWVIRAWVLQILHSFSHAGLVRTRLFHDMLWRWFVGYDGQSDSLPDATLFVQDMEMVSVDPGVIDVVYRWLNDNPLLTGGSSELRPNLGYLQTLHARHFGRDKAGKKGDDAKWQSRMSTEGYWDMEGFADTKNVVFIGTGTDIFGVLPCMSVNSAIVRPLPGQPMATVVDILSKK